MASGDLRRRVSKTKIMPYVTTVYLPEASRDIAYYGAEGNIYLKIGSGSLTYVSMSGSSSSVSGDINGYTYSDNGVYLDSKLLHVTLKKPSSKATIPIGATIATFYIEMTKLLVDIYFSDGSVMREESVSSLKNYGISYTYYYDWPSISSVSGTVYLGNYTEVITNGESSNMPSYTLISKKDITEYNMVGHPQARLKVKFLNKAGQDITSQNEITTYSVSFKLNMN